MFMFRILLNFGSLLELHAFILCRGHTMHPRFSCESTTANSAFATEKFGLSVEQAKLETCHEIYFAVLRSNFKCLPVL